MADTHGTSTLKCLVNVQSSRMEETVDISYILGQVLQYCFTLAHDVDLLGISGVRI